MGFGLFDSLFNINVTVGNGSGAKPQGRGPFSHEFKFPGNAGWGASNTTSSAYISLDGLTFPAIDNGQLAQKTDEINRIGGITKASPGSTLWNTNKAYIVDVAKQTVQSWADQRPGQVEAMTCTAVVNTVRFEVDQQTQNLNVNVLSGHVECKP